jgi:hypothetical protein
MKALPASAVALVGLGRIAENGRVAGGRPRPAHIGARRIAGRDQIPADRAVFCAGKFGHFHQFRACGELESGFQFAAVAHSARH